MSQGGEGGRLDSLSAMTGSRLNPVSLENSPTPMLNRAFRSLDVPERSRAQSIPAWGRETSPAAPAAQAEEAKVIPGSRG